MLLALPLHSAASQALRGRVINDSTKEPIQGAEVAVEESSLKTMTDVNGRFLLAGLPGRISHVIVRKVGFRPVRARFIPFGTDTLVFETAMVPAVVELAPVEVVASAVPPGMQAYAERRALGQGAFIDWTELRKNDHRRVSDLIDRIGGVSVELGRGGKLIAMSRRGGTWGQRQCSMAIWLDGVAIYQPGRGREPPDINEQQLSGLEAIEVYRSVAVTPSELRGTGAACGTIVLWTRRR